MGNYLLVHATLPLPAPTPPQHLHAMFFLNITTRPEDMSTIENHLEHVTSDEERFQSFFVYYVEEILHYQHLKQQAYLTYSIVSTSQIHRLTQQHTIYSYTSISPDEILLEMDDFENEIVQGMKLLEQLVLWNVIYRNYQHMLRACITMGMDLGAMISEKPFAMISTIDDTALIRACREGYVDLVKHLVEVVGVDVNTMNNVSIRY